MNNHMNRVSQETVKQTEKQSIQQVLKHNNMHIQYWDMI